MIRSKIKLDIFKNKALVVTVFTVLISVLGQLLFVRFASFNIEKIDYGNFVLLQTLIAGMSAILLQIPSHSFDRFYNAAPKKIDFINEFRTILLFVNFISIVLVFLYSQIIDKFTFTTYALLIILFMFLNNFTLNQKVLLFNLERGKFFFVKVSETFSKFVLPIGFYWFEGTLESLFFGMVLGYFISNVLILSFLRGTPFSIRFNIENIKKYFTFSSPVIFMAIFTWGISFSDRYFIEYYLTTEDVAIYSILAVVAGIGVVIGQIYFMYVEPKIYKAYEVDKNHTITLLNKYLLNLSGIFIILFVFVTLLPRNVFTLLIDKALIDQDYYYFTILVLIMSVFLGVVHTAHHMVFKLKKRFDLLAYIYLIAFMINMCLNFFIKESGIIMAGVSTLISYASILILQLCVYRLIMKSNT